MVERRRNHAEAWTEGTTNSKRNHVDRACEMAICMRADFDGVDGWKRGQALSGTVDALWEKHNRGKLYKDLEGGVIGGPKAEDE